VFLIAPATTSYKAAFGSGSAAPYLRSLKAKGTLLSHYDSLGRSELSDYLAMISGQAPDADTGAGCTTYAGFPEATEARANGLVTGNGCVYPETVLTIGDQVSASGHVWRAYIADMGKQTCLHPNSDALDDLALPGSEAGYDTRHNPFIYFHSLLDLGDCATDDQDLSRLPSALARKSSTATFSFIAPGACEDPAATTIAAPDTTSTTSTATTPASATPTTTTGTAPPASDTSATSIASDTSATSAASDTSATSAASDTPATGASTTSTTSSTSTTPTTPSATATTGCPPGQPVGISAEDAFLRTWVPRILASAAYRQNGVLVIAFAESGVEHSGRAVPTGALVLSRYTSRGAKVATAYSPYSLLHSVEDMLGYTPLGHAKSAPSFAETVLHKNL
jgi:hypothetical protein